MSSQFPRDEHGQYLTLECINEMKNAEYVNVFFIQTDLHAVFIPSNVLQDGQTSHAEKFTERIYFKQEKNEDRKKREHERESTQELDEAAQKR